MSEKNSFYKRALLFTGRRTGAAVFAAVLVISFLTACPNKVSGSGGNSEPADNAVYVEVPIWKLKKYLAEKASPTEINYIELVYAPPEDLYNNDIGASKLGNLIREAAPKKIALRFGEDLTGITDMSKCFYQCKNLISVKNIPEGVTRMVHCFDECTSLEAAPVIPKTVTDMHMCFEQCSSLTAAPVIPEGVTRMYGCFSKCTNLKSAPVIPKTVTDMHMCFEQCSSLTAAPVIPESVTKMQGCFFNCANLKTVTLKCKYNPGKYPSSSGHEQYFFGSVFYGCEALEDGGIKVPQDQLRIYENNAETMGTSAAKFAADK